jgi:hypothetical protein
MQEETASGCLKSRQRGEEMDTEEISKSMSLPRDACGLEDGESVGGGYDEQLLPADYKTTFESRP